MDIREDAAGHIYLAGQFYSRIYRLDPDGIMRTAAGNGVSGPISGYGATISGILATQSPLTGLDYIALDGAGNLYIDIAQQIAEVDAQTGVISSLLTVPFKSRFGITISSIESFAVAANGDIYIGDSLAHKIFRFTPSTGIVLAIAGNGMNAAPVNGVQASASPIGGIGAIVVAPDGTIYFSSVPTGLYRIDGSTGVLTAVNLASAGSTLMASPISGIRVDSSGNVFVLSEFRLYKIDARSSQASLFAGVGSAFPAAFNQSAFFEIEPSGAFLYNTYSSSYLMRFDPVTGNLTQLAGNGMNCYRGDGIPAIEQQICNPEQIAFAPSGALYIGDSAASRVLALETDGALISAMGAGFGSALNGARTFQGPPAVITLGDPGGVWIDSTGNIYVNDMGWGQLFGLDAATGTVTAAAIVYKNMSTGSGPSVWTPAVAADSEYIYFSEPILSQVWRVPRSGGAPQPYAGNGTAGASRTEGPASAASLWRPGGLAVDSSGNLYIADASSSIWKVDSASQVITVVIGGLQVPVALAFDHAGNLCFTEWEIGTVSCMDLKTKSVERLAGTGTPGFSGDGGAPLKAQLNQPSGILFDAEDNLYISDSGNQRIRVIRRRPSGLGRR